MTTGDDVASVADLAGKTIYSTGKGTTPEYVLNYILTENGIDPAKDVTIEYKSEATEVLSTLQSAGEAAVAAAAPALCDRCPGSGGGPERGAGSDRGMEQD